MTTELTFERFLTDLKEAMKARENVRVDTLRMVISALKNKKIDLRADLTHEDILAVLSAEAKKRREAFDAFTQGGRQELAEKEAAELVIIEGYLPKQLTEAEVRELVAQAKNKTGATTRKEMGKVMGVIVPQIKGRFDGSKAREIVTSMLE
jgi:uncharacterized protein YqeY